MSLLTIPLDDRPAQPSFLGAVSSPSSMGTESRALICRVNPQIGRVTAEGSILEGTLPPRDRCAKSSRSPGPVGSYSRRQAATSSRTPLLPWSRRLVGGVTPVPWTVHGFRTTRRLGAVVHN